MKADGMIGQYIAHEEQKPAVLMQRVRQAYGKSIQEMARSFGVDEETWLLYESGDRTPELDRIDLAVELYEKSPEAVGDRLQKLRKKWAYDQKEMASFCDVGHRTWQAYERGERLPSPECLQQMISLEVDVNWILNGVGREELQGEFEDPMARNRFANVVRVALSTMAEQQAELPHDKTADLYIALYEIARKSENGCVSHDLVKKVISLAR